MFNEDKDLLRKILITLLIIALILTIYMIYSMIKGSSEKKELCESRGGIYQETKCYFKTGNWFRETEIKKINKTWSIVEQ